MNGFTALVKLENEKKVVFDLDIIFQRRYSQSQSPGSPIWDFIKNDSFVLISC
jgi:hypothetical protein